MNKFTGWIKHWYRYKTDEPYIISAAIVGALALFGSILMDRKKHLYIYAIILILIALWALFRSVTFKKNFVRDFVKQHQFSEDKIGLDIGTGTGYALIKLARDTQLGKVYGVEDKYQYTIRRLEKNAVLERVKNKIELTTADINKIPFEDRSIDVVTAISANGNQLSTPKKAIVQSISYEMKRVLMPSGVMFMVNTPAMIKKYAAAFEKSGFEVTYMHRRFERFFFIRAIVVKYK
ncbi:MAG: class I SAM-dependent methyltransferase [Apilactobacillus sp.]|uniref:class I SAM-dependent methyltransferase n=1 Tax=Apilactobacillus TaxID=2767877 RepID=UPI0025E56D79|nr:class I SAM-dependent methyltransferase [Apilactobacillus sp.]MCT6822936.1 class I SAM-dependent methyltransferase [Apilactobacillus sp.]MCT6858010.1 class I SAM-dependent methyltransferase [Apilactobacillus sp.]